ncbi:unnamed protein product [Owenia fusiformis]|uniref:Uncharacterized protein n=1 Tax=Owenia fusiformis TaxID=6347 RepID=A0A8J1UES8_OWEFU|nr:unnamed protein product [Owenia fusiformis]
MELYLGAVAIFTIAIVTVAITIWFLWKRRMWCFKHMKNNDMFDAYLIYDSKDGKTSKWVLEEFVKTFEKHFKWKLNVNLRDTRFKNVHDFAKTHMTIVIVTQMMLGPAGEYNLKIFQQALEYSRMHPNYSIIPIVLDTDEIKMTAYPKWHHLGEIMTMFGYMKGSDEDIWNRLNVILKTKQKLLCDISNV